MTPQSAPIRNPERVCTHQPTSPIFTGDDVADFVAYLDAHGVPRQRCFRNACRRWADRARLFGLCFWGTISRCISTCEGEKLRDRYNAAVHYSVGMLFVPRRKFGGLLWAQASFHGPDLKPKIVPQGDAAHMLLLLEQQSNWRDLASSIHSTR
jgi:hypothetical protein